MGTTGHEIEEDRGLHKPGWDPHRVSYLTGVVRFSQPTICRFEVCSGQSVDVGEHSGLEASSSWQCGRCAAGATQ